MKSKKMTRFLNPLLTGLLLTLLLAAPALADVATLVPDGVVVAGGNWSGVTVANLNDGAGGAGGGDGTSAAITGFAESFTVSMSNDVAYTGTTINSVTLWIRADANGSGGGEKITFGLSQPVADLSANTTISRTGAANYSHAPAGLSTSGDVDAMEVDINVGTIGGGEDIIIYDIWVVVDFTPIAGSNELNACDSCHTQPPAEGASRNVSAGAVVGSHAAHTVYTCTVCHPNNAVLTHRGGQGANGTEGQIDMLANIQGGTYSLGSAGFLQDNEDGTGLGTCSDISCHGGAATTTPQWGSVAGLNCDGCHGAPPATNAHATHYTSKGWGATDVAGTYCVQCHPDNTAAHSDVTDATIIVNAGLTPSGASPAISCGNAPALGCHNGKATPNWNTSGITCTQCHTAGGADPADPTSGLHDETPVVSGVQHNPLDPNFTACDDCHTATPSDNHWDGVAQTSAPIINFDAGVTGFVDGTPATCASSCHNESGTSGPWARKWHENSDLNDGTQCTGCHGDWANGWNSGVTHRGVGADTQPQTVHGTGTNYECKDCHALEAASGYTFTSVTNDWGGTSQHGNGSITINNEGTTGFARGTGGNSGKSGCTNACHADGFDGIGAGFHSFTTTGWTLETVNGDAIVSGCDSCHGGSGQYWPNGASYPNTEERHDEHMTQISSRLGITLPGTDLEQKRMCQYCHLDPGGSGHSTDSGDSVADVTNFNPIWDATNPPSAGDTGAAFVIADGGCNSIDCHNNTNTGVGSYGWRDAITSACTMCHTAGVAKTAPSINPTTGLHDTPANVSSTPHDQSLDASGCVICHTATPSSAHIDGSADASSPVITIAGSSGFTDGGTPTCANVCHSDGGAWNRLWHENSEQSNGTECAGCHGTFATGFNTGMSLRHQTTTTGDAGGQIEANHDGADKCLTCHAYDGADTYGHKWATHHLDNTIQISDQTSFSDDGATVSCTACHTTPYGTADGDHSFTDTTVTTGWTRQFVTGPVASCTSCHSGHGTGAAGVGANSPHSNDTAAGGGVYTCEGCHTAHNSGTIEIPNRAFVGINYSSNGESGIALGGAQAPGATEAEICWNCHNTNGVSEWGKTWGAYTTGTLNQDNWVGATWTSANFSAYKNGTIQSVHATGKITAQDSYTYSNALGDISCSYCHDVHDTGSLTGDPNNATKPYLRGTWTSNPFKEDGAPLNGQTMASDRGAVPRGIGSKAANGIGGWQIEQNNTSFGNTTYGGVGGFAGICATCHSQGQLETDWSGHQGAVSGFSGGTGNNFLNPTDRGNPDGLFTKGYMSYNQYADQAAGGRDGGDWVGGLRNARQWKDGIAPQDIDSLKTTGTDISYPAGAVTTIMSGGNDIAQDNFHNFPCAKCHNPHASRLDRLMITNCLDVSHNTWDDTVNGNAGDPSGWGAGTQSATELAYSTTAQNCHRYTGAGTGWNTVTPW